MSILIENIDEIYTADNDNKVIKNGYIIINNGIIEKINKMKEIQQENKKQFDKIIDAEDKVAIPGLINTHTHSSMTLLRGYADDLPLKEWLETKIWPFESRLRKDDFYWGTKLAILEMIKTGTTTFSDMYFSMDEIAKAVKETGIRAVLSEGLIEENDGEKGLQNSIRFAKEWNNKANGRIKTMLAPHSPYTCSREYLKRIVNKADEIGVPIHTHLAETENEVKITKEKYGKSPTKFLEDVNFFSVPILAAHCIYLDESDMEILAENNVGVAHNPLSNMKLGSGIANITKLIDKGINIGLGTDGVASNNNLDLFEEAKIAAYLQKVDKKDPSLINTNDLLKMLTINGAKVLGIDNLGKLKEKYIADLVLLDINKSSYFYPHHNNLSNIFYSSNSNSVNTVIIDGKVVLEDGNLLTMEENKVFQEVERRASELV
ncbi:MAG TPA: amidohydrolase family protein [Halanaerobiales bacterium]|nr:amidohydrolase family protein [Halanaerobiales bacterium]